MKKPLFFVALMLALAFTPSLSFAGAAQRTASQILNQTGVKGGLVVHLGCGDGALTAALRANEGYLVHGLDTDPENVARARQRARSLGVYGKVAIDRLDGPSLPYADNLVNLLVAEELGKVSMDECLRVLAPDGEAFIKTAGKWKKNGQAAAGRDR